MFGTGAETYPRFRDESPAKVMTLSPGFFTLGGGRAIVTVRQHKRTTSMSM
jgi:hypothetical protein